MVLVRCGIPMLLAVQRCRSLLHTNLRYLSRNIFLHSARIKRPLADLGVGVRQHFGGLGQEVRLATWDAEDPFQFVDVDSSVQASTFRRSDISCS